MGSRELNEALAGKRKLIAHVAGAFSSRSNVEYDDAFQIVSMEVLSILENPPPPDVNVDGLIVTRGVRRLLDELRSGRITGIRRAGFAAGQRAATSLNARISIGTSSFELVELVADEEDGYREIEDRDEMDRAVAGLEGALACLPERERRVVYFVFYEELSQSEVAVMLGVSESRVSQLVARAHQRMRAQLAA
jgi:RNA polymerase sigma factor (sigma-70 family)